MEQLRERVDERLSHVIVGHSKSLYMWIAEDREDEASGDIVRYLVVV